MADIFGKWLTPRVGRGYKGYPFLYSQCSECGHIVFLGKPLKKCPNCGAEMDSNHELERVKGNNKSENGQSGS